MSPILLIGDLCNSSLRIPGQLLRPRFEHDHLERTQLKRMRCPRTQFDDGRTRIVFPGGSQFVAASRCFLLHPDMEFFFPPAVKPLSDEELLVRIDERGSALILIEFQAPDVVEDVLFPQLRKAEDAVKALLERSGFSILRSNVGSYGDKAVLLFELDVWQLPRVARRMGPPVWEAEHLSRFLAAHPHIISGPYIEDGRAVIELSRRYTLARDLLASEVSNLSLGKHLTDAVRKGHNIYVGEELAGIKDRDFRAFMARYLKAETRIC